MNIQRFLKDWFTLITNISPTFSQVEQNILFSIFYVQVTERSVDYFRATGK